MKNDAPQTEGTTGTRIIEVEPKGAPRPAERLRPRDSATLILLERKGKDVYVLMGRRHSGHAFMPDKFVFPGGRTDPTDNRIPSATELHPAEEEKLIATTGRRTRARARAIALSAVRETYEEAGLLIGRKGQFSTSSPQWQGFVENGVSPALDRLRFVARAITPPGRVRRFDSRFLAAWRDEVAVELEGGGPTNELEDLVWLPIAEAREVDIPRITRHVLGELEARLADDPDLSPGGPVPFYRTRRNQFTRTLL